MNTVLDTYLPKIKEHLSNGARLDSEQRVILTHMEMKNVHEKSLLVMSFFDGNDRYIGAAIELSTGRLTISTPENLQSVESSNSCYLECMDTCGSCYDPPRQWACSAGCRSGCGM